MNAWTNSVPPDVAESVRSRLGLSADQFATLLGVAPTTVRRWQQGRTESIAGSEAVILRFLDRHLSSNRSQRRMRDLVDASVRRTGLPAMLDLLWFQFEQGAT